MENMAKACWRNTHTVHISKCEEFATWTLSSLGLWDQIMFASAVILEGSMQSNLGLSVRMSCTFLLVSF